MKRTTRQVEYTDHSRNQFGYPEKKVRPIEVRSGPALATRQPPTSEDWDDLERRHAHRGQTRHGSLLESTMNIVVGFLVAFVCNMIVLPWFGFKCTPGAAFGIGLIFTAVSFVRSYILRRVFNKIMLRYKI